MKQTKLNNIPDEGNESLAKSPVVLQRELDAKLNGSGRPSGKAGWIVGGLPGHAPLPTDRERKEWAKKFNGGSQTVK